MPVLPSEIPTGLVTGQFYFVSEDNVDADTDPTLEVVSGDVLFTCSAPRLRMPTKLATVIPLQFRGVFDAYGRLVSADDPTVGLKLPATDSSLFNPTGFTWKVEFNLRQAANRYTIPIASFDIQVPAGGTVDLTTAMPVDTSPGVITVQGPPGPNTIPTQTAIQNEVINSATPTRNLLDARFQQNIPLTSTLNFYLSPTGNDANDGLTAGTPKLTFQATFDLIKAYATYVGGQIYVNAAAGTYPMVGQQTLNVRTANRVVVRGPSVSGGVPTAIIDGAGGGDYQHGLSAAGIGVRVEFRDLKFINFNGDPSGTTRSACLGEQESDLYTNNVHVNGASWAGVYAFNTVRARVYGGIIENCRDGVAVNDTDATVGQSTAPITIKTCSEFGVYWSRGSQGHVDYATIQDCSTALMIDANSRVDTVAVNFKRNTIAISTRTGGVYNEGGAANIYNDGTADANTTNFNFLAYSGKGDELGASRSWSSPAYDRVLRTVTGTTSLTPLNATLWTLPARRLQGVGKRLRIHAFGIHTVTAGTSYTVSVGGMSLTLAVPAVAAGLTFEIEAILHEVQGGYRMFGKISQGLSSMRMGQASAGFVNSIDNAIGISVTPANAADTTSIYSSDIYVMG